MESLREAIVTIRSNPSHVAEVVVAKLGTTIEIAKNTKYDEFTWPNEELISSAERTLQLLREENIVKEDFEVESMFLWAE